MIFDDLALERRLVARVDGDELVAKGIALARQVHAGALRDEGTPYISHPLRVALILLDELGISDRHLVCAAVLHDAAEDDPAVTGERLLADFGPAVARLVRCLTDEFQQSGLPRAERRALYLARIARAEPECLILKICDRIDNLRSLLHIGDVEKREEMRRETETHLLPALADRPSPFPELRRLTADALRALGQDRRGSGGSEG